MGDPWGVGGFRGGGGEEAPRGQLSSFNFRDFWSDFFGFKGV